MSEPNLRNGRPFTYKATDHTRHVHVPLLETGDEWLARVLPVGEQRNRSDEDNAR